MFEVEFSGQMLYDKRRPKQPGDDYFERMEREANEAKAEAKEQWLDSPEAMSIHRKMMGHYLREMERQAYNREQMALDEAFYDHEQWTEEELAVLAARGQAPLVFNVIQTSVNWVLGSQRRATTDYKILPRTAEGSKAAEAKTELFKHLADTNGSEFEYADAFADAVKAGIGWMETGQGFPEDGSIVFDRRESWRSMLWDSTSSRYDLQDARYIARAKWLDADVGMALWPARAGLIRAAASDSSYGLTDLDDLGDYPMDSREAEHFSASGFSRHRAGEHDSARPRFRAIEIWFKRMAPAKIMRGGQFNGELLDEWSPGHWHELSRGAATLIERPREQVHCALITENGILDVRESPYRHNKYPFTPIWGYRRATDGMPYGIIRGIRDIQRDLNKRASKALHHLSTTRVIASEGSVKNVEDLRDEAARPDAVILYNDGHAPPEIKTDTNLAAAHMDLMRTDAQMIQSIAGVTDENMGRQTNAKSGKAIIARQEQGALATSHFFDNLRRTKLLHGEKLMVNIEQFYTEQHEFRITDQRGNAKFIKVNDGSTENAIATFKADFTITEDDWRATVRQSQAEQLLDLFSRLASTAPQIVMGSLDLLIEALDVPKRDEFVKRIRQMTGVQDPDADPNNPSPEQQAQDAAKAESDAMAKRAAMAELEELEAKAMTAKVQLQKLLGSLTTDQMDRMIQAITAAQSIAAAPAIAPAADAILRHAEAKGQPAMAAPAAEAMPAPQPMPPAADPMAAQAQPTPIPDPANQGAIQ